MTERLSGPRHEVRGRPTEPIQISLDRAVNSFVSAEQPLPVTQQIPEIHRAIQQNDRVIIEADTGSGKSTVTPLLLLQDVLKQNRHGKVVVTQPRRIAAESLAKYLGEKVDSGYVGFHHRGGGNIKPWTQLEFTVERSFLNELLRDPLLQQYDTVMLDEVHERSIDLDIIMPLLKKAQAERAKRNRPLKLVLTSATLDEEKMMSYFDGAKHVEIPGKLFKVEEEFAKEPIDKYEVSTKAADKAFEIHTAGEEKGDMLIFMPGKAEIQKTIDALQSKLGNEDIEFLSLLGGEESSESMRKIHEQSDKRRIFVATNVAETSITIPSVRIVIDSGLMRTNVYDPNTGISGLRTIEHTQSNAKQRKGRAGRTAPGWVHFLFTKESYYERQPYLLAEIMRTDLATQVLMMKDIGIDDIQNFDFLDHPGKEKIDQAVMTLQRLGALDKKGELTEIGKRMTEIDADPRYARMLVEAEKRGCLEEVSVLVGVLGARGPIFNFDYQRRTPFKNKYWRYFCPGNDMMTVASVWNDYLKNRSTKDQRIQWSEQNGIKTFPFYEASNTRKDILKNKRVDDKPILVDTKKVQDITESIVAGLTDNIVDRIGDSYKTRFNGSLVQIDRNSGLQSQSPRTFVAGRLDHKERSGQTFASYNIAVTEEILQRVAPYLYESETAAQFLKAPVPETDISKTISTQSEPQPINIAPTLEIPTFTIPMVQQQQLQEIPKIEEPKHEEPNQKSLTKLWNDVKEKVTRYIKNTIKKIKWPHHRRPHTKPLQP